MAEIKEKRLKIPQKYTLNPIFEQKSYLTNRTNLISSRVVIEESNCIQCLLESRLTINKPAIESSFKLQMKNDNIVVHINSKDIN